MRAVRSVRHLRRTSSLAFMSAIGWVAISKSRKFRFSVRSTPLSTRPFANRSRTCLSWYPIFITFHVSPGSVSSGIDEAHLPLIRSTQAPAPYFSLLLIIFRASSRMVSPVWRSSITSIRRSASASRRRDGSRTTAILLRNANSIRIQPRRAYEILSFQNERYPLQGSAS